MDVRLLDYLAKTHIFKSLAQTLSIRVTVKGAPLISWDIMHTHINSAQLSNYTPLSQMRDMLYTSEVEICNALPRVGHYTGDMQYISKIPVCYLLYVMLCIFTM